MTDTTRIRWLRLWTDFVDNFRVNMVSEIMQARLVKLWCIHRRGHLVGAPLEQVAFEIRLSVEETEKTIEKLIAAGLLEADRTPHGWDKRQRQYDNDAKRMREARQRKKEEKAASAGSGAEQTRTYKNRSDQTRGRNPTNSEQVQNMFRTELVDEVVAYLNEKANRSFRSNTKATQRLIRARVNEDYAVEDFKAVIDGQCDAWLTDAEMVKYLRPETLFGPKFEGYLQAARSPTPPESDFGQPGDRLTPTMDELLEQQPELGDIGGDRG